MMHTGIGGELPDDETLEARDARDWHARGVTLAARTGREADAEAALREAIAAGADDVHRTLGLLLCRLPGRAEEAEAPLRDAIAVGSVEAVNDLGILLEDLGRDAEAEAAYREAIALGHPLAHGNLGALLSKQPERQAEAESAYREAIALGTPGANGDLGLLLSKQPRRKVEAEAALRAAIAEGDTGAWLDLGLLLRRFRGRDAEEEQAYRKAMDSGDEEAAPKAALQLGHLLHQRGALAEARRCYERALEPRHVRTWQITAAGSSHYLPAVQRDLSRNRMRAAACLGRLLAYQRDATGARAAFEIAFTECLAARHGTAPDPARPKSMAARMVKIYSGRFTRRPARAVGVRDLPDLPLSQTARGTPGQSSTVAQRS